MDSYLDEGFKLPPIENLQPVECVDRFLETTDFLLTESRGELGYLELLQSTYLADRNYFLTTGNRHFVGPYLADVDGPLVVELKRALEMSSSRWNEHFEIQDGQIQPKEMRAEIGFTSQWHRYLRGAYGSIRGLSYREMIRFYSHECPEWIEFMGCEYRVEDVVSMLN